MATPGANSAVSEPIIVVTDHGVIAKLTLPEGFSQSHLSTAGQQHNNLEYKMSSGNLRICYEQMGQPLYSDFADAVAKLFAEKLPADKHTRQLNFGYDQEGNPYNQDDADAYGALCQCFVFGGRLMIGGSCLDEEASTWEIHTVGDGAAKRNVIVGNLRFCAGDTRYDDRQAVLVIPAPPGAGGCGYVWLEGKEEDLAREREEFLHTVIGGGQFRELEPPQEEEP